MHKKQFLRKSSLNLPVILVVVLLLSLVAVPVSAQDSTITFGISNNVDTLDPNVTTT